MTIPQADLEVKQGDTCVRVLTVTRDDTAVDLTDATLTLHVRTGGGVVVLDVLLTSAAPATGMATLRLTSVQTAALDPATRYVYEVELVDAAGDVSTLVEGRVFVARDRG